MIPLYGAACLSKGRAQAPGAPTLDTPLNQPSWRASFSTKLEVLGLVHPTKTPSIAYTVSSQISSPLPDTGYTGAGGRKYCQAQTNAKKEIHGLIRERATLSMTNGGSYLFQRALDREGCIELAISAFLNNLIYHSTKEHSKIHLHSNMVGSHFTRLQHIPVETALLLSMPCPMGGFPTTVPQ